MPAKPDSKNSSRFALVLLALAAVIVLLTLYVALRPDAPQQDYAANPSRQTQSEQVLAHAIPLLQQGQHGPAIDLMEAHLRTQPDDTVVRTQLAEALLAAGRTDQAESAVDEVLVRAPRNSQALWFKGLLVGRRGEDSMEFFRKAAESPDASPRVWAGFGLMLLGKGELAEAEEYLRRARRGGIEDERTLGPLGDLALRRGDHAEAETLLTKAVRQEPANARLWVMLAEALEQQDRDTDAAAMLAQGLTTASPAGPLHYELAAILWRLNRPQEAADSYVRASDYPPLAGEASLRAGRAYFSLGQYGRAEQYIDRAAKLRPGDEEVAKWKQQVQSALAATATQPAVTQPAQ